MCVIAQRKQHIALLLQVGDMEGCTAHMFSYKGLCLGLKHADEAQIEG